MSTKDVQNANAAAVDPVIVEIIRNGLFAVTEEMKTMTQQQAELEKRVTELERWKWLVMGGSIVIGAILQFLVNAISK